MTATRSAAEIAATQWQPIATAPKDGTKVLILVIGLYASPFVTVAQWSNDIYSKKPHPRFESSDYLYTRSAARTHPPTHWMPLPAPPSQEPSNADG